MEPGQYVSRSSCRSRLCRSGKLLKLLESCSTRISGRLFSNMRRQGCGWHSGVDFTVNHSRLPGNFRADAARLQRPARQFQKSTSENKLRFPGSGQTASVWELRWPKEKNRKTAHMKVGKASSERTSWQIVCQWKQENSRMLYLGSCNVTWDLAVPIFIIRKKKRIQGIRRFFRHIMKGK